MEENVEVFNKYVKEYEEWFEKHKFAYLSEIEALKKVIPKGKGIEIGVGHPSCQSFYFWLILLTSCIS
jgi:hypothetical protein